MDDKIDFVPYDTEFLELSWQWLHDPEIKRLTATPDFTKEQQQEWFQGLKTNTTYFIKGIRYNDTPIGMVALKNIDKKSGEYLGIIGEKAYWGKGIGKKMIAYILNVAKMKHLKVVYLRVPLINKRAIELYKKSGFIMNKERSDSEQYIMEYPLKNPVSDT